jgi:hypothetical protein
MQNEGANGWAGTMDGGAGQSTRRGGTIVDMPLKGREKCGGGAVGAGQKGGHGRGREAKRGGMRRREAVWDVAG